MTKIHWFAALVSIGSLSAQTANAEAIGSTYSETQSCAVTQEGEDAFIRECHGPGNVRAVLQYVDGLFGVFYLPMGGKEPMERSDMLEVSPNARFPYGAKHEWRVREGDPRPCAAIIRAYTAKGEVLVVTELANGKRLGRVKTNAQARTLADNACQASTRSKSAAVAAAVTIAFVDDETIAQAAARGEATFSRIYEETGISGAIEEIKRCYDDLKRKPSIAELANCAALDIIAATTDNVMTRGVPGLAQPFFSGTQPDERIATGIKWLNLDEKQRSDFDTEIARTLGITLTTTSPAPALRKEPKSVFDFSTPSGRHP